MYIYKKKKCFHEHTHAHTASLPMKWLFGVSKKSFCAVYIAPAAVILSYSVDPYFERDGNKYYIYRCFYTQEKCRTKTSHNIIYYYTLQLTRNRLVCTV